MIDFDAMQVDPATLKFGAGQAPNAANPLIQDVDGDIDLDAVFLFEIPASGILCGDEEVALQGDTYLGESFIGTDAITTIDYESSGCHP